MTVRVRKVGVRRRFSHGTPLSFRGRRKGKSGKKRKAAVEGFGNFHQPKLKTHSTRGPSNFASIGNAIAEAEFEPTSFGSAAKHQSYQTTAGRAHMGGDVGVIAPLSRRTRPFPRIGVKDFLVRLVRKGLRRFRSVTMFCKYGGVGCVFICP